MEINLNNAKMARKGFFLIVTLFFSLNSLNGQISKKTLMVGGNFDLQLETPKPVGLDLQINPTIGYFAAENFAIGLQFNVQYYTRSGDHRTVLGLGPMARYYVGEGPLSAFGHFAYLAFVDLNSNTEGADFMHIVFPGVGLNYMLFPTVGLEGLLGIYLGQIDPTISLSLGLQFYIPHNDD